LECRCELLWILSEGVEGWKQWWKPWSGRAESGETNTRYWFSLGWPARQNFGVQWWKRGKIEAGCLISLFDSPEGLLPMAKKVPLNEGGIGKRQASSHVTSQRGSGRIVALLLWNYATEQQCTRISYVYVATLTSIVRRTSLVFRRQLRSRIRSSSYALQYSLISSHTLSVANRPRYGCYSQVRTAIQLDRYQKDSEGFGGCLTG